MAGNCIVDSTRGGWGGRNSAADPERSSIRLADEIEPRRGQSIRLREQRRSNRLVVRLATTAVGWPNQVISRRRRQAKGWREAMRTRFPGIIKAILEAQDALRRGSVHQPLDWGLKVYRLRTTSDIAFRWATAQDPKPEAWRDCLAQWLSELRTTGEEHQVTHRGAMWVGSGQEGGQHRPALAEDRDWGGGRPRRANIVPGYLDGTRATLVGSRAGCGSVRPDCEHVAA